MGSEKQSWGAVFSIYRSSPSPLKYPEFDPLYLLPLPHISHIPTCDREGCSRGGAVLDEIGERLGDIGLRCAVILGEGVGEEEDGRVRGLCKPLGAQGVLGHEQGGSLVVEVEPYLLCHMCV